MKKNNKMNSQSEFLKWPISEDFFANEEISRVAAHILGIDSYEVDETHISFLLDTYPQCFTLLPHYGMTTKIIANYLLVPDGLTDDIVSELVNLLNQREKAPPLTPKLIRLLFHLEMFPRGWYLDIFNRMEVELDIVRKLLPVIHFISRNDGILLNDLFRIYKLFHIEDTHLLDKMSSDQLIILISKIDKYYDKCIHTESIRPKWAVNYFNDSRTSSHRHIKNIVMELLGMKPQFPTDFSIDEIIDNYGFVRPYRSREELLDFYLEFLTGNLSTAFVVLPSCKLKAENDRLYFLTDPISEVNGHLIGIGSMNNFSITTLDELAEVWNHGVDNQCEFYQSPFSVAPMPEHIVNIISKIIFANEHTEALHAFGRVMDHIRQSQSVENKLRRDYFDLSLDERSKVLKIVKNIFMAGMYMRRWDGIGPYPTDKKSTKNNAVIYDDLIGYIISDEVQDVYDEDCELVLVKVSKELENLRNMYESLSLKCKNIIKRIQEYDIRFHKHTSNYFWENIGKRTMENDYCIRMASSIWIGTSVSFYQLIGKEPKFLHNFKLTQLEFIQ